MSKANKFILNGEVIIDLTQDTITEDDVVNGKTFHRADGEIVTGTKNVELQRKTAEPKPFEQSVIADDGRYGLSEVVISPVRVEQREVNPSKTDQVITPSEANKYLSHVTVKKIPEAYIIPSGSFNITENGTHDVKDVAYVQVNVAGGDIIPEWDGSLTITKIEE